MQRTVFDKSCWHIFAIINKGLKVEGVFLPHEI